MSQDKTSFPHFIYIALPASIVGRIARSLSAGNRRYCCLPKNPYHDKKWEKSQPSK